MCCSMSQRVAANIAVCNSDDVSEQEIENRNDPLLCSPSVLQCVAMCCNVLQCYAACCTVLHCEITVAIEALAVRGVESMYIHPSTHIQTERSVCFYTHIYHTSTLYT